ncbi:hypothetical protein Ga0076813_16457 [endosymbiont of Ridgeia piscesae]|jgi:hypothetical protein|uniref:Uncharacterized protein n=2 Tax=sulfur-oxidizing symbionts TaxID=32036 RepID=G2FHH0_9GAMM|nr:hypothetical protein TevJSym_av00150 [endosymbiont of Tevnia jerichonana (vent Tica)]KRT60013.1 hypothetical protein Ga0076813_16457 [endosymbiont of Ridgeia piscesae]
MSEKSAHLFSNICTSCMTAALIAVAAVTGATLLWVMML